MAYPIGSKVIVTELQPKDYDWLDNEFEKLSEELKGKSGVIEDYLPAAPQYGEREAYLVRFEDRENTIELEPDEFIMA